MPERTPDLAAIAACEFDQRRTRAREMVATGKMTQHNADALLAPWLALVLLCDAPVSPALAAEIQEWRACILVGHGNAGVLWASKGSAAEARADMARELCPDGEWRAALGSARDAAILKARGSDDRSRRQRARDLNTLARAFCVPLTPAACGVAPAERPAAHSSATLERNAA
ncbi:hypothetical protein [Novosphingobium mangrovi (ex Huang et al. 2023)]|uniref:TIGR02444 family protein n=1 Tax=Novosphingobium mangrovi (ex Huang et al. 2023) TaxID=2976432 RepID=A0ABT2I111_9SPHN|nr:hypothetical protein [Novosphingobium mangrovi (ex Huang et al. 2023)]MCT2398497.1 hypothetical protein [Novosphingobium mangrovi (ex Huang et al. 2023)]